MDRLPITKYHKVIWTLCSAAWFFNGYDQGTGAFVVAQAYKELQLTVFTSAVCLGAVGLGMLVGSYVLSYMADQWGRRIIFQFDILIYAIFCFARIFSTSWVDLTIYTTIMGFGLGGLNSLDVAYLSEYLPPKGRGFWLNLMLFIFVPGLMLSLALPLAVPFVPTLFGLPFGWRLLPVVGVIPALLIWSIRRTFPESVRFFLSRGRVEEAAKVVERFEASAGPDFRYTGTIVAPTLVKAGKANPRLFFKSPWIKYTIPFWLGYAVLFAFTNTPAGYLPTVFLMGLGGAGALGLFTTVAVSELTNGATQILCRGFSWLTMDTKHGRRLNLMVGSVVPAIGLVLWAYPWMHRTTVSFWYLVIPGMMVVFGNSWFMGMATSSTELYPTELRVMAVGWGSGLGRLMSATSFLFMAALMSRIDTYFYAGAICWLAIAAACWLWIPDTTSSKIDVSSHDQLLLTGKQ